MVLVLDVGNTNIVLGCCQGEELLCACRVATRRNMPEEEYATTFLGMLRMQGLDPKAVEGAIISSVVPPLNNTLQRAVKLISGKTPMLVGPGVKTGVDVRMDAPHTVGSDLIVDAAAALALYPAPLIVVDLGTATTLSILDAKRSYVGTVICPGVGLSVSALSGGTAQLPKITLEAPPSALATNTVHSMQAGAVFGTAAMLDGMIQRIEADLGSACTVVATGGIAPAIIPHCRREDIIVDDTLTLKGLRLIYEKNKGK